jgi:hypothetical protein
MNCMCACRHGTGPTGIIGRLGVVPGLRIVGLAGPRTETTVNRAWNHAYLWRYP